MSTVPPILLMGPTGSGKTALALEIAARFRVGLISVDSALVYRGLDVGAAKPDRATLTAFPHELVDIADPAQPYSTGEFLRDVLPAMERVRQRDEVPLLVGGTMLWFRALQAGMADLPPADPVLRAALAAEAAELMEQKRITSVLVVNDKNELCGVVNSNDLMRAKVI